MISSQDPLGNIPERTKSIVEVLHTLGSLGNDEDEACDDAW